MQLYNFEDPLSGLQWRVRELRDQFGPQPWLTVVSGVTAEAYRLAGLTGDEFAQLLETQTAEWGSLLIERRRKPVMRLRAGFDGHNGSISEDNGIAHLNFHFEGGSYIERNGLAHQWPALQLRNPRSSLLIAGGCNRPASQVVAGLPRCLQPRSIRGGEVCRAPWGQNATMRVIPHWETLALMPDHVARDLRVQPQRTLDQMPWFDGLTPVRQEAPVRPKPAPVTQRARPALRLVSSS